MPLLITLFFPVKMMEYGLYVFALLFLTILGAVSARTGGSSVFKAVARVTFWGTIAMGLTALAGYLFGVSV